MITQRNESQSETEGTTHQEEHSMQAFRWLAQCTLTITTLICTGSAWAQGATYPAKPVTLIVPFVAGSIADVETRLYAPRLTEGLGKPVLIDYKPGAGSSIGTIYVAKSAADGYTLVYASPAFSVYPAFFAADKLPYDPVRDFAAVTQITRRGTLLLAHPSLGVKTFPEYLAYAKANPEAINFGTSGGGGILHIVGAWLHSSTNTKVTFIHYKGSGPMFVDLVAGRVTVTPTVFFVGLPYVKSGKLLAIANMGLERSKYLPDLKTMDEQGLPGFDYSSWSGYFAPARTPDAIVERISAEFAKIAKAPDLIKRMDTEGAELVGSTPEQFRKIIATEAARWRKVVQENGIKLEE